MHFVAALDRVEGMRCVLGLFEGVVTGAADGYARMSEQPAATLLHLGPGLANGLANIHNANKASTPMVNIVGDHATYTPQVRRPADLGYRRAGAPVLALGQDLARRHTIAADGAAAIAAARKLPGQIATLILPADTAWNEGEGPARPACRRPEPGLARGGHRGGARSALGRTVPHSGDRASIAAKTGSSSPARSPRRPGRGLIAQGSNARTAARSRAGLVERVPYVVDQAPRCWRD